MGALPSDPKEWSVEGVKQWAMEVVGIHFEDTAHFLSCKAGRGGAIYNNAGDLIFNGTAEFHSCVAEKVNFFIVIFE